jgi:Histidine kinase-, DNA gyrase B-, and HSP90-like ATPase
MDMAEDLPRVRCEPREIQQVFFNIINNAIAVMKGGGVITVETRAALDGRKVEIRISDTGTGIRKEHRTQIFDPLFTTKRVGEGTGLGLSVSYGVITKYGGSITFETRTAEESKETGTTFIITLPSVKKFLEYEPCWELTKCPQELRSSCAAYLEKTKPCWESNKMYCKEGAKKCEDCIVYLQKGKPAHNADGVNQ